MSDEAELPLGAIAWIDLTVPNAAQVRDFYKEVVGWDHEGCDMGGYEDFNMLPPGTDQPVAGICHAVGANTGIPASWMIYITVPDVDAAAAACVEYGGEVLREPKGEQARMCVIRDPAGAVCALFETKG